MLVPPHGLVPPQPVRQAGLRHREFAPRFAGPPPGPIGSLEADRRDRNGWENQAERAYGNRSLDRLRINAPRDINAYGYEAGS
jgi:hypothetical protein